MNEVYSRVRDAIRREAAAIIAMADELDPAVVEVADILVRCRGRVLVVGVGTSRAVAQRAAHLLCCTGRSSFFLHPTDGLHGGAGAIEPNDIVIAISKGGGSAEVNTLLRVARDRGATVVTISSNRSSEMTALAQHHIWLNSPDDIDPFGMIATGSSLVASAAADALCLAVLELGKYSFDAFAGTHPGGAVGSQIRAASAGTGEIS